MAWVSVLLVAAGCAVERRAAEAPGEVAAGDAFVEANRTWRAGRLERLTAPYGYLSLAGFELLPPGRTRLGSTPDNDIVMARGPGHWGVLVHDPEAGTVRFENAAPDAVRIDGEAADQVLMDPGPPTTLEADGIRAHLVAPGGRPALRVRDPQSPVLQDFAGLDYFELDADWRMQAEFLPHPEGTTIPIANVIGQLIDEPNPGRVRFRIDDRTFELEALGPYSGRLFFIFADRTSGRSTYGLGRFLYADLPDDQGRVVMDFNQSYNPPCAFNPFTTCPMPPPGNRLDLHVEAGELTYRGKPGVTRPVPVSAR